MTKKDEEKQENISLYCQWFKIQVYVQKKVKGVWCNKLKKYFSP